MNKEKPKTEYNETSSEKEQKRRQKLESAIDNFSQKEVPQHISKKKNKWLSPLVLVVAIAIGVFLIIKMSAEMGEEQKSFAEAFAVVTAENALWAILALLCVLFLDILKFVIILHATTDKIRPLIGAKTSLLGRYYDNITPFSSGGQPMQIYYLYHKGFTGGLSSAVVMIKYFFNTTAWLLVAFVCMVCNTGVLKSVENGTVLLVAGWVGWSINVLLPIFILMFVIMPKFARKLTRGVVHIGYKLKLVKDKEKVVQKAEGAVRDFRSAFVIMSKRPLHLVVLFLSCLLELSLTFAFPYFIIKMFNGFPAGEGGIATMFEVMALHAYAAFGASVIPTPGSSGAVEGLITMAFSAIAGSTLMWVIFTWRFATFYLYIFIGVLMSVFNLIRSIVREKRAAKAEVNSEK